MNNLTNQPTTTQPVITVTVANPMGHQTSVMEVADTNWLYAIDFTEGHSKTVQTDDFGSLIYVRHESLEAANEFAQANNNSR